MLKAFYFFSMNIVPYGGGVNSTAMIIELINTGVKLDFIIFSDTGGEQELTYKFIQKFSKWIESKGQPPIIIVKHAKKDGEIETLEQELIRRKCLPPIAYGFKSCSEKYKIRPLNKFLKENHAQIFTDKDKPIKYIGFDKGEERRMQPDPTGLFSNKYPLIEWGLNREDCKRIILENGLCLPPKSSCFFCPNMKKREVLAMDKALQERAMFLEKNAKDSLIELKGLGRVIR